jgi:hypothetical protein
MHKSNIQSEIYKGYIARYLVLVIFVRKQIYPIDIHFKNKIDEYLGKYLRRFV